MLDEQRTMRLSQFPKTSNELWQWCLDQDVETLLRLLAYCAARTVNGVKSKGDMDGEADWCIATVPTIKSSLSGKERNATAYACTVRSCCMMLIAGDSGFG